MKRIWIVMLKEWLELRRERTLLLSTFLPALLLPGLALGIVLGLGLAPDAETAEIPAALADPTLAGLGLAELGQVIFGRQFTTLFLLLPMMIPNVLASYSIVGEKTRRTLEPLLATPLEAWELLTAKALAALLPGVALTWFGSLIFALLVPFVALDPQVARLIVTLPWVLLLLLVSPFLAQITLALTMMISARVNDPRSAQQIAAVVVVPVMLLFFGQLLGVVVLDLRFVLGLALGSAVLAVVTTLLAACLFGRESILTRWS
jgi:ABC-2 type transport system permease protein